MEAKLVFIFEDSPEYSKLNSEIRRYYQNSYRRHYMEHVGDEPYQERFKIADGLAHEINEHFVELQPDGYKASEQPRPVKLPPTKNGRAIELMTDYLLAEDHLRGLTLRREANGQTKVDEEFPPLGEGACEYFDRETYGPPFSREEVRLTKTCEICASKFIDESRAKNAKVCGDTCRGRKDALRKRVGYNEDIHGLENETRVKRYRERQDFEYPYYSPYEMSNMGGRSEKAFEERQIDRQAYRQDQDYDAGADSSPMANFVRFEGRRKPGYIGADELSEKVFKYSPKGRNSTKADETHKPGPVLTRKIGVNVTMEILESEKFSFAKTQIGRNWNETSDSKDSANYTSENYAI